MKRISIIGANSQGSTKELETFAFQLGRYLMKTGYTIINGGMGGTMEATSRGASTSEDFEPARMIAILPMLDEELGNKYSGVKIRTEMGMARNKLVVDNGDAVIAIGGGAGTLNEMTIAWKQQKPIAAYTGGTGWSKKMAGTSIDDRRADQIYPIADLEDVKEWFSTL